MTETRQGPAERPLEYGVPKERIPRDWINAREMMDRHPWAVFHVRTWYFPVLVALALVLFAAGVLLPSLEFSAAALVLTVILYTMNKRARRARELQEKGVPPRGKGG